MQYISEQKNTYDNNLRKIMSVIDIYHKYNKQKIYDKYLSHK